MKSLSSKFANRWKELPQICGALEALLFVRIFLFAAIVPFLMRLELPRLQSLLSPESTSEPIRSDEVQRIIDYVEAAIRFGRPFIRDCCLTRGMARYYFLNRVGLDVTLCFGMGLVQENFAGHCWVVMNGEPFLETRDPRPIFKIVYSFPGRTQEIRLH